MKRLNNTEITALAEQFIKDNFPTDEPSEAIKLIKNSLKSEIDTFSETDDYKILKKYNCLSSAKNYSEGQFKVSSYLPEGYSIGSYSDRKNHSVHLNYKGISVYQDIKKIGSKALPDLNTVKRAIILAQIEATELKDIMNKLKETFNG